MSEVFAFSVYDDKAAVFQPPFFFPNKAVAIRNFGDALRNPELILSKHPGDFKLFCVGTFDEATGEFVARKPEFLVTAVDCLPTGKEGK